MPTNPMISLKAQVPNVGASISNALTNVSDFDRIKSDRELQPLRNRLLDAKTQSAELGLTEDQERAEINAMRIRSIGGQNALATQGREGLISFFQNEINAGPTLEGGRGMIDSQDFLDLIQNNPNISDEDLMSRMQGFEQAANRMLVSPSDKKSATVKGVEGDFTFRDQDGNIFSQQTFLDPNTKQSTPVLTNINPQGPQNPVGKLTPIQKTGESVQEERLRESAEKVKTENKILDIKNSKLAEGEKQKKLGIERAKIGDDIRSAKRQAVRSKSNVLKLKRALKDVNTGRLAEGRNLIGGLIPGVRDADVEAFNSLATQFALDELSRQSGTKTDFDFKKAEETQARLGNTKEANEAIINIALDRIDEIENEDRQFKAFIDGGGNAEDFEYEPVPLEHIEWVRKTFNDKKIKKEFKEKMKQDFKAKYGFLPSGL